MSEEYNRKIQVAGETAQEALTRGGLSALGVEVRSWRSLDCDPVILAELERIERKSLLADCQAC